ncbi:MAG TPA: MarR family winged helix-turn-helix transcriptional regulator, partial [Thermomicrobiales bacterium]|nr:MarR family winged helix-turn-helix transcriptional regulator [Thermomicrobiales bacterium]
MPTSATIRVVNQARVLAALRRQGPHSRVSLSEDLGLTRSTVTVIVTTLLEQGLVEEVVSDSHDPRATGRPRVELRLRSGGAYFGGLDIGNETLTTVIVDLNGHQVEHSSRPLRPGSSAIEAEHTL